MDRTRRDLHLERVLFCVLLDLLEVLVIAVLRKPCDDIARRPVDLESVGVLIVDMVLQNTLVKCLNNTMESNTHINGHLIDMNTLLDTKLRDQYIEGCIQDTDNLRLADDRPIALCEIMYEDTEVQVSGLLLRQLGRVTLATRNSQ